MTRLLNPYENPPARGVWLTGTLHAHSHASGHGAVFSLPELLRRYASLGYDFVMPAEHDLYTPPEALAAAAPPGSDMILIPGCELIRGPHLLHVGANRAVTDQSDTQRVLDHIAQDRALAIAAHPSYGDNADHIPVRDMLGWRGLTGLEVYNGLIRRLPGSAHAADKWDALLTAGRRLWGFADDDAFAGDDIHRGWTVALATDRSLAGVLDALRAGRFIACAGPAPRPDSITTDGLAARLHVPRATRITAIADHGRPLATAAGPQLAVTVPETAHYVRFTWQDDHGATAWSQPMFVER